MGKPEAKDQNAEDVEAAALAETAPQYLNFRDIRNKFGIDGELPTEQSLFGAKKSPGEQEVDCVEMLAEEESKLEQEILGELQNDPSLTPSDNEEKQSSDDEDGEHRAQDSINVKIKFILFDLGQNTYHKDFKDYRFWMKIAQKKFQEADNDELAIDFLRNGLREVPKSPQLLYNYACANEKVGNYQVAVRFFRFASKLKQNWTDALFGEAVTHFKLRNYTEAEACIVKALKSYKKADAMEEYEVMLYFKAMVYKKLKDYDRAKRDYESLQGVFCHNEGQSILHFVVGLILLPLRESRREKFDYLENTLKLIKHFKKVQPKEKNKVLSNYVNKRTGYLDMEKHKAVLIRLLRNEPFFKRFDV
jgi:tetratricopeptide (TPR) repeat protein